MLLFRIYLIAIMALANNAILAQSIPPEADSMLRFIQQNPKRVSFLASRNDTIIGRTQENQALPLASTVKILVAVEFAKQAAGGIFNGNQRVALRDLDIYYLPNTDGDAHTAWKEELTKKKLIVQDSISLMEVARGMIMFSSNANTEFLMDLLGLDNVKNNIQLFGLKSHTALYPIVSSLFMYQNPKNMKEEKVIKAIRNMKEEEYCKFILAMHNQLKLDSSFKSRFRPQDLSITMQRCWSDLLPRASAADYVQLVKILNNRRYLESDAYAILADILEFPMESPAMQRMFTHLGMKGGSTMFVLTKAMYSTDKKGNRTEYALFINDLTPAEQAQLEEWLDMFELQLLINAKFRSKLPNKI